MMSILCFQTLGGFQAFYLFLSIWLLLFLDCFLPNRCFVFDGSSCKCCSDISGATDTNYRPSAPHRIYDISFRWSYYNLLIRFVPPQRMTFWAHPHIDAARYPLITTLKTFQRWQFNHSIIMDLLILKCFGRCIIGYNPRSAILSFCFIPYYKFLI